MFDSFESKADQDLKNSFVQNYRIGNHWYCLWFPKSLQLSAGVWKIHVGGDMFSSHPSSSAVPQTQKVKPMVPSISEESQTETQIISWDWNIWKVQKKLMILDWYCVEFSALSKELNTLPGGLLYLPIQLLASFAFLARAVVLK